MLRSLTIQCPPMGATNTGYWFQPGADRITDELVCRGEIENVCKLTITFPPCRVYRIKAGQWMVEPVIAKGKLDTGEYIQISYPEEPVLRSGRDMFAQPVNSIDGKSYVLMRDLWRAQVKSKLPLAKSSPVGLGLTKYIVEAVTLPGFVEWPT